MPLIPKTADFLVRLGCYLETIHLQEKTKIKRIFVLNEQYFKNGKT